MRLTSFVVVTVVLMGFQAGRAGAQIPESALFQPGSYAHGPYVQGAASPAQPPQLTQKVLVEVPAEAVADEADDVPKTEWEEKFATAGKTLVEVEVPVPVKQITVPYLAWHRNPITHRIHVVPYQPGYAASPEEFPEHQSKLNLWLSSLPCRVQDRPQVKYAGYYDPDPEIIEDKPSRLQLILGYPNGAWTSNCDNRWGYRMAQCPGVVPVPMGTYAEVGIKDQPYDNCPVGSRGGILRGPRPLDYGVATPYGWRHTASFAGQYTQFSAMTPQPGPYPRPMYRHGVSRPFGVNCDCGECRGKCGSTRIGACKGDGCTCGNCSSNCGCDDCGCGNDARFFDNRRHAGHQNRAARKADECGCCERGGGVQDGCAKKIPSPPKKKYPLK